MNLEIVSYSEIDAYRQCRLKHQLSYIERWRSDEEHEALARGTLFHSVMEAHYRTIMTVGREDLEAIDLWAAVRELLYDPDTGEQTERQELVEWIYRGYVEHYGLDEDWEILGVEQPLLSPLLWPDGTESGFALAGTVDLIIKDRTIPGSGKWITDHKTCRDLPKQKDFDMEDQTAIYTHLLRQTGDNIRGAIYNHCRTRRLERAMTMDERFLRTITVRTDEEIARMTLEALETMEEAYNNHWVRTLRNGDEPYDAPRSPDGERCGWRCGFTEPCLTGRKYGAARTRTFMKDIGFTQHETKPGPSFNKPKAPQ